MNNSKKGRGVIKLFLLLSAAAGAFVLFFPLIEERMPSLAERVNAFRGYYTGPLFIDPAVQDSPGGKEYFTNQYHGIKDTMKDQQLYYFIPSADVKLVFSSRYEPFNAPIILNLYRADDLKTVIATDLEVPFEPGRQRGARSQMGEDVPDHANWFDYKCRKGIEYALKVLPEENGDIGKEFVVHIDSADGWISIPGLWALFEVFLIVLLVLYYIGKFARAGRKH